ncbi:hypothetical protein WA026_009988 [Henosepilachna vigintioctopunctata]|uniref:Glucose-methanol-choline oxidoreductase N-terminal domain-containing protein n=1 Tax=Henosepilachna vigintioctopunctata TaxID=420089 RepID=A0AAW1TLC6_9CUCU
MEILTVLIVVFHLVMCQQTPNDLKVEYYAKNIRNALALAEDYQPRQNNSDLLATNQNASPIDFGEFDFIIVGSGSSGSAFAAKMSEIKTFKILSLEAGDYNDDLTKIPYLSTLFQKSDRNWGYFSSPQKNACFGWIDNRCSFPRGKILGGSSAIDGVDYIRGNKADFDNGHH